MRRWLITSLIVVGLGVTMIVGTRAVERKLTFPWPVRYDAANPWKLPPHAEDVWFVTSDGVHLHGWFLRSPLATSRGAALYLHGNGGNVVGFLPPALRLQEAGYDVLLWDYRGYGRSEGTPADEASLYRDGDAAVAALARLANVPAHRIILYGHSLGTAVGTELAVRHGCRALALEAPFASARKQAARMVPGLAMLLAPLTSNRFQSLRKIPRVRCPVIVVHGDADELIPVSDGIAIHAAAAEPKQLVVVPGGRHGVMQVNEVVRFVEQHTSP
jgi:pimeloyl-ACP methyl ester carboxylesterase